MNMTAARKNMLAIIRDEMSNHPHDYARGWLARDALTTTPPDSKGLRAALWTIADWGAHTEDCNAKKADVLCSCGWSEISDFAKEALTATPPDSDAQVAVLREAVEDELQRHWFNGQLDGLYVMEDVLKAFDEALSNTESAPPESEGT